MVSLLEPGVLRILRPGTLTSRQLAELLPGRQLTHASTLSSTVRSPGQKYAHYQPLATVELFEAADSAALLSSLTEVNNQKTMVVVLNETWQQLATSERTLIEAGTDELLRLADEHEYARRLYQLLRQADRLGCARLWAELPPPTAETAALRDRLQRAGGAH